MRAGKSRLPPVTRVCWAGTVEDLFLLQVGQLGRPGRRREGVGGGGQRGGEGAAALCLPRSLTAGRWGRRICGEGAITFKFGMKYIRDSSNSFFANNVFQHRNNSKGKKLLPKVSAIFSFQWWKSKSSGASSSIKNIKRV